ncbi:hypothetical protein Mapa_009009 [Marchantia paleacea]|nr:hypothetical protein Mapa_009009 [Marchantia paleacea]
MKKTTLLRYLLEQRRLSEKVRSGRHASISWPLESKLVSFNQDPPQSSVRFLFLVEVGGRGICLHIAAKLIN